MNKIKVLVWAPCSSYYPKQPAHIPLSEPRATPQPSSSQQAATFLPLLHLPSKRFHWSQSNQGTRFHPHYLRHTWSSCRLTQMTTSIQWDACPLTGPLLCALVSTDASRLHNSTICKSSSLSFHKSLSRLNYILPVLWHLGWKQVMTCNYTLQRYKQAHHTK